MFPLCHFPHTTKQKTERLYYLFQLDKTLWQRGIDPHMKVAWFAEDLNNDKKVGNYVPPTIKYVNLKSLSSDVLERDTSTVSGLNTLLSRDFEPIFF